MPPAAVKARSARSHGCITSNGRGLRTRRANRAMRPMTSAAGLAQEATDVVRIVAHVSDGVFQFLLAAAQPVAPVAALPGRFQVDQQLLGIALVCVFGHGVPPLPMVQE